jgi:hypothetical protein
VSYVPSHWVRPLKSGPLKGKHVLIYVREDTERGVAIPAERRVWSADLQGSAWNLRLVDSYNTTDRLDSLLDQCCAKKGETAIWLLRGWTDLVLSGLAELMDAGAITWRFCNISGHKLLIRGSWRGRKVAITSLGNWTGGRWENWGDTSTDVGVKRLLSQLPESLRFYSPEERTEETAALATFATIVHTSSLLGLPRVAPTSAAAGLLTWRAWLGNTVHLTAAKEKGKKAKKIPGTEAYLAPLPNRPKIARAAERHIVYPLTSRQLCIGHVEGPIYCLDVRAAYLLGLMTTPLPICYVKTLKNPTALEASESLCGHTGLALVRLNSDDYFYPCRINGRVIPCKGRFWTWLCGTELALAYFSNHVEETWCAHYWIGELLRPRAVELCFHLTQILDRADNAATKKAWRSVYSSLVGRFAGWSSNWSDSRAAPGFGRWATWQQADPRTGAIVPYRSVAGKVQMLRSKEDSSSAVPLMFGTITSQVRWFVRKLAEICGYEHVFSIVSDSIWVSQDGWQKLQRHVSESKLPPDNLRVKAIYDQAWMTGGAVAVVERDGKRQLIMPGVRNGVGVDPSGHIVMEHTDDWSGIGEPIAAAGVPRRKVRYSAAKVVEHHGAPASPLLAGETLNVPLLDEALLQPLHGKGTIDDA